MKGDHNLLHASLGSERKEVIQATPAGENQRNYLQHAIYSWRLSTIQKEEKEKKILYRLSLSLRKKERVKRGKPKYCARFGEAPQVPVPPH